MMAKRVSQNICRKDQGIEELGSACLKTPGTCDGCPLWWQRRQIKAYPAVSGEKCDCCGKDKARRKGKSPAPVRLIARNTLMHLCMTCAKKISSCLDAAIERIESKYV
jgi:hypothetical protein